MTNVNTFPNSKQLSEKRENVKRPRRRCLKKQTLLPLLLAGILILSSCTSKASNGNANTKTLDNLQKQVNQITSDLTAKTLENKTLTDDMARLLSENEALKAAATQSAIPNPAPTASAQPANSLLTEAMTVVQLLKIQDMATLSNHVHPTLGVRFSPYAYVDTTLDVIFTATQISTTMTAATIHNWGAYDGSGDPISMTFANYFNEFVYDEDYANPQLIGNNTVIGNGNTPNNIATAYPTAGFVDFHFNGFDPQFDGMDWSSLRLVFEQVSGTWYLVGVIHGLWTI